MAGGGTTARGFLISLGAAFLSLLWDVGELVRLQRYVQSEVSIVSNWGAVSVEEGLPQHTYCLYHGQRRREGRIVSQQR